MNRSLAAIAIIIFQVVILTGCSWFSSAIDPRKGWSVEQYYEAATDEMNNGNYDSAVKTFESLEARYPYGRYAQQAQLQIAYAHYKQRNVAEATAACDRFIKQYPTSSAVDYAYYLKGLANFNTDLGYF